MPKKINSLTPVQLKRLGFCPRKNNKHEWYLLGNGAHINYYVALNETNLVVDEIFSYTLKSEYNYLKTFIKLNEGFQ